MGCKEASALVSSKMTLVPTAHWARDLVTVKLGKGNEQGQNEAQAQWGRGAEPVHRADTPVTAGIRGTSGVPDTVPALTPFLIESLQLSYGFSKTKAYGHLLSARDCSRSHWGRTEQGYRQNARCPGAGGRPVLCFPGPQTSS